MTQDPDLKAFAEGIQGLASQGGFDPMALLSGAMPFHSVFLAPFTPSLRQSITRFLADGGGPLAGSIEALRRQGVAEPEARERARTMFSQAQGMCVVVLGGEHGISTIPQLFFGTLSAEWRAHALAACGKDFSGAEALARALTDLASKAEGGTRWPALIAGPGAGSNILGYFLELAHGLAESLEGGLVAPGSERLADLGSWIGTAVPALMSVGVVLDADDAVALARCHLVSGDWTTASSLMLHAVGQGMEQEALLELLGIWVEVAARAGEGLAAGAWLTGRLPDFEQRYGPSYDLARGILRLQASAQADSELLLATCELLRSRDRKSFRHDLTLRAGSGRCACPIPGSCSTPRLRRRRSGAAPPSPLVAWSRARCPATARRGSCASQPRPSPAGRP